MKISAAPDIQVSVKKKLEDIRKFIHFADNIIFLLEISLLKFDLYTIVSMLYFSSLECLQKIWPLINKWSMALCKDVHSWQVDQI